MRFQRRTAAAALSRRAQVPQIYVLPGERPRLDLSLLPRAPAADVVLVKVTYWWI